MKEIGLWELIEKNSYKSDFLEVFHHSNKSAVFDLPIYTIKRKTFDNHLLNHAIECGTQCIHGKFFSTEQKTVYKAKIIILATGCQSNFNLLKQNDIKVGQLRGN